MLGGLRYIVGVAQPNNAFFGYALEKHTVLNRNLYFAVFRNGRSFNNAVAHPRNKLTAVANTENGNAKLQYFLCVVRRFHIVNAVRSACENNTLVIVSLDDLNRGRIGEYFSVNIVITDSACNQLIILTAEVQNKNFLHISLHLIICRL